ncbi:MAG: hypothetical protein E4G99_00710 [Anaerolineales bacterium]|nr:MAG: hypothetical protein E4G99_00710 [Anaerolineales bacterium]
MTRWTRCIGTIIHGRSVALLVAGVIVLVGAVACNLPGPSSTALTTASAAGQETGPQEPASTTPATEVPLSYEPPAPAGLIDVLYSGVESGSWSYEKGLVEALKILTGETRVEQFAAGQHPSSTEGSGIVREAQLYLKNGQDAGERAEIERLLGVIAPAPERLLEVADPEPVTGARPPGYAARLNISQDCEELYKDGFPSGSGLKCLLYKEGGIGGQLMRVFYPLLEMPLDYADAAYTSVMQSFEAYAKLAPNSKPPQMKGVDLLFVVLPEIEDPTNLAMVPTTGSDQRCLIVVYLGAIQKNEAKKGGPDDFAYFSQTVAHEMFHCFQTWNFPAQTDASWKVQDWWGEGTAEFFSNVVYPYANGEWEWTGAFSYHSADTPLTGMGYENSVFFQYLADQQGNNAVLDLISAMPSTGSESDQATALSKLAGMDKLFHDFGQAFLDGQVQDSSGSIVPSLPAYIPADHVITVKEAQIRLLESEPFVLQRYTLVFPQGYRYTISQVDKGPAQASKSARIDLSLSQWAELPDQALTACSPVTYLFLLTTVQAGSGKASVEVSMTPQEELACDKCLVGTWEIDTPSFADYLAAPFKDSDPNIFSIDSMGGTWRLHFTPQSMVTGEYDYFVGYELDQTGGGSGFDLLAQVLLDITGDGTAQYISDGVGHISFYPIQDNFNMEQTVLINGQEVPGGGNLMSGSPFSSGIAGAALYSCDTDSGVLYLTNDLGGGALAEPVKYNRISSTP